MVSNVSEFHLIQSNSDSLVADDSIVVVQKQFITETRTEPLQIQPAEIEKQVHFWQLMALLMALLLLALLKVQQKNFFSNLRSGFYSKPIFNQLLRDGALFPAGAVVMVFLAKTLIFGVLLMQLEYFFNLSGWHSSSDEFGQLIYFVAIVGGFFLAKYFLHYLIGAIFGTMEKTREYLANSFYYDTLISILISPVLFLSTFTHPALSLLLIFFIVLIMITLKIIRGGVIANETEKYSLFQIFLYFCALEFLPVLAIYKLIVEGYI
jgi:hypothetical protein